MKTEIRGKGIDMTLAAVLFIIIGVVMFIWPLRSTTIILTVIGIILLIAGAVSIIAYITTRDNPIQLIIGIIVIVMGIILLIHPIGVIRLISIIFGIILLVHGIQNIVVMLTINKNSNQGNILGLLLGIITIIMAILLLLNGVLVWSFAVQIIAVFLIVDGIINLITGNRKRKFSKGDPIDVNYREL